MKIGVHLPKLLQKLDRVPIFIGPPCTLCLKKRPPFSYDCSFYNWWPIFIMFGTQYIELICNTTVIYLSTSPTYCCYTTLGNIGCSSGGLTGQSYTLMHKNWCLIFVRKHEPHFHQFWHWDWWSLLSRRHTDAADAAIHSFHCWWLLRIPARQCTSASCMSQSSSFSVKLHNSLLQTYNLQTVLI